MSVISITKTFVVECSECEDVIDEQPSYKKADEAARHHRAECHPRTGMKIGGTWYANNRSTP